MIILISPTKKMEPVKGPSCILSPAIPQFHACAAEINGSLEGFSSKELAALMKSSPRISDEVLKMIRDFKAAAVSPVPALYAYSGTVFSEMGPGTLEKPAVELAGRSLRILSAYYGLLRPEDGIRPYRLDMKTPLKVAGSLNLYTYWRERVTTALEGDESPILNLASSEYFRMVDKNGLGKRVLTVNFKEKSGAGFRSVGMYSKMARGRMIRKILTAGITGKDELKKLDIDGYTWNPTLSSESAWVFSGNFRV